MSLILTNIDKYLNNTHILKNINLTLSYGEIIGLIGPNGAGKTTLLRTLATLYQPNSGDILFKGNSIFEHPSKFRENIGYMPEECSFYNKLSASKNLEFYSKFYNNTNNIKIEELLIKNDIDPQKKMGSFSKGMRQKVSFIKSFMHNPIILLLDEPFNFLDPEYREKFKKQILNLNNDNKIVFISSHILNDLNEICNRFIFLNKGCICKDIRREDINYQNHDLNKYYFEIINEQIGC